MKQNLSDSATTQHAWTIVDEYISFFGIKGIEQDLWALLVASLTNNEIDESKNPAYRHDKIFFYEFTLMFIQAVDVIRRQRSEL